MQANRRAKVSLYTTNRTSDQERNSDSERRSNAFSQIHLSVAFICGICRMRQPWNGMSKSVFLCIFATKSS